MVTTQLYNGNNAWYDTSNCGGSWNYKWEEVTVFKRPKVRTRHLYGERIIRRSKRKRIK